MSKQLLIGKSAAQEIYLESALANRHGLIAGATGTGIFLSTTFLVSPLIMFFIFAS